MNSAMIVLCFVIKEAMAISILIGKKILASGSINTRHKHCCEKKDSFQGWHSCLLMTEIHCSRNGEII